jgi:glutathione synthase/RimK-type ligase-like ATP-grasp enzyme
VLRYLFATEPRDLHSLEVALALEARGAEPLLWMGADFPTLLAGSIEVRDGSTSWELRGLDLPAARPPFDGVWLRRPTAPILPPSLHPADRPVAEREVREFVSGLYLLAAPEAFWVNPLASRARGAESKAAQLAAAASLGFAVPPTLLSNDPERIREFLAAFRGRAVYKPFFPAGWQGAAATAVLGTSEIEAEDLPPDDLLRATPGIFQARVEKAYELRVTAFGGFLAAARIDSQALPEARLDSRAGGPRLPIHPAELPPEVERRCFELMGRLGLVFGCFDFAVTPGGDYVFFEVNPAGQFLWVEEACPEIRLLAPFVEFLLARRADFRWRPEPAGIRHEDLAEAARRRLEDLAARHVDPPPALVGREEDD